MNLARLLVFAVTLLSETPPGHRTLPWSSDSPPGRWSSLLVVVLFLEYAGCPLVWSPFSSLVNCLALKSTTLPSAWSHTIRFAPFLINIGLTSLPSLGPFPCLRNRPQVIETLPWPSESSPGRLELVLSRRLLLFHQQHRILFSQAD